MPAEMVGYTIYDHPKDYPDNFVVRRWTVSTAGVFWDAKCQLATTLEEARRLVPDGTLGIPRFEEDDPVIVETWF